MAEKFDLIRLQLISEYEHSGPVDIATWVRRYPNHREELLDFWMWLKGTASSSDDEPNPVDPIDSAAIIVYEAAVKDACLAVTFGGQWLKPAFEQDTGQLEKLATELATLRSKPRRPRDSRAAFRKAVVCTWVVSRLQQKREQVTRLATQKVAYLVEQAMNLDIFVEHDRKPLGPYDRNLRYKDAEPIALKKGWLSISGTTLKAADDLSELERFLPAYVRSKQLATRLVDYFARFSDDQLETLATVHWVARDLDAENQVPTVETVTSALGNTPEWKAKLSRPNFSSTAIQHTLLLLRQLRLV